MAGLLKTNIVAEITWLGLVPDRERSIVSESQQEVVAQFSGFRGESHSGLTRPSCSRVSAQYPVGTEIKNTRQLSILSAEELDVVAAEMKIGKLDPTLIGASMIVSGVPNFTLVPPSSRLIAENGTSLTIDLENGPCHLPVKVIENAHPDAGALFKTAAKARRGVTAWVEREGSFCVGDKLTLHIPDQPAWEGGFS